MPGTHSNDTAALEPRRLQARGHCFCNMWPWFWDTHEQRVLHERELDVHQASDGDGGGSGDRADEDDDLPPSELVLVE